MMNSGLRTTSWLYEQEYLKSWGGVFFVFAKLGVRSYKFQSNEPSVNWKCDKVLPKLPVLTVSSSDVLLKWLRSQTVIRSFFSPHVFIPFMFILYTCSREKTPVLRFPKPYFCSFFRSSSEDSMYGCCSTCQSKSSSSSLSSWHGSLMLHAPLKSGRGGRKKKRKKKKTKKWNSGNKEKTLEELEWQKVNAWDSVTVEHTNLLHQRLCRPGTCGGQETGQHVQSLKVLSWCLLRDSHCEETYHKHTLLLKMYWRWMKEHMCNNTGNNCFFKCICTKNVNIEVNLVILE